MTVETYTTKRPAVMEEVPGIIADIGELLNANGADQDTAGEIQLAIEEAITNIAEYGFPEGNGWFTIHARIADGLCSVEISDNGTPFNPLKIPPPDLDAPLEERRIGGLGIHMIRHLMDHVTYANVDGSNVLMLEKDIRGPRGETSARFP